MTSVKELSRSSLNPERSNILKHSQTFTKLTNINKYSQKSRTITNIRKHSKTLINNHKRHSFFSQLRTLNSVSLPGKYNFDFRKLSVLYERVQQNIIVNGLFPTVLLNATKITKIEGIEVALYPNNNAVLMSVSHFKKNCQKFPKVQISRKTTTIVVRSFLKIYPNYKLHVAATSSEHMTALHITKLSTGLNITVFNVNPNFDVFAMDLCKNILPKGSPREVKCVSSRAKHTDQCCELTWQAICDSLDGKKSLTEYDPVGRYNVDARKELSK